MEIKTLVLGDIAVNCYLVSAENAAVVIDPGYYSNDAESFLKENENKKRLILLTHAHYDHIGGAKALRDVTGVKIAILKEENEFLSDNYANLSSLFGDSTEPFSADILFDADKVFTLGNMNIKVISAPGHTPGSAAFLINGVLFSGDTLFFESVGCTDFPGGSYKALTESVKKLYTLPDDTTVYPGHGEVTDILHEKRFNPFVREKT